MGRQCKSINFEGEGTYVFLKTYSVIIILKYSLTAYKHLEVFQSLMHWELEVENRLRLFLTGPEIASRSCCVHTCRQCCLVAKKNKKYCMDPSRFSLWNHLFQETGFSEHGDKKKISLNFQSAVILLFCSVSCCVILLLHISFHIQHLIKRCMLYK